MENKNNTSLWVGGGIVLVVIALFWFMGKGPASNSTPNDVVNEPASTQDVSSAVEGATGVSSISYANALIKYADRRIQLDKICQATPNQVTYKDNTGIMIDNRSPSTRTIKVGTIFTIKPYGFKIVILPDIYLKSKTLLVDCDKSQNVASVLVQE